MSDRTLLTIIGQAGSTAQTVIPDNPTPGTAYRNASLAAGTVNQGWAYDTVVDSADQNQLMYLITGVLRLLEQTGILPWCATVAYPSAGVFCLGSDNQLYISLQASTGKNPISESTYWQSYTSYVKPTFGAWATKSVNTIYQAATDGFVTAHNSDYDTVKLSGYTDSNSNPTTIRTEDVAGQNGAGYKAGIMFPVRKGDYWKVTGKSGGDAVVFWLPFGT